jgi:hypothetical protein
MAGGNVVSRKIMSVALVLLAVMTLLVAAPAVGSPQWTLISLPSQVPAGTVPVIGMSPNFPSDHVIFMEDGTTVYESQDGGNTWYNVLGAHWSLSNLPILGGGSTTKTPTARIYIPPDFAASHLVVWCNAVANDDFEYLPTQYSSGLAVFFKEKSTVSPQPTYSGSGIMGSILQGFAFAADSTMYAGGGAELYSAGLNPAHPINAENPEAWTPLCFLDSYIYDIELSPNFENDLTMLVQTDDRGVLISTNGGQSFTQTSLPVVSDRYYYIRFSPNYASDGTMAAVVPDVGLFLSTDRGADWKDVLPGKSLTAAAIGPSGAIYAGTDYTDGTQNGVYASFDQGQAWQNIGLEGSEVSSLYVFKGTDGDHVYAATESDLAWTVVNHPVSSMPSSSATIGPKSVRFVISQDSYTVDDSVYQMDAAPYIENGHYYVPLRYLARALNMGLSWDGTTKTIKLSNGEKTLGLQIGVKQVAVDGESEILNYPPVLKDGHAYLMATLLSTYFNYNLTWDGQNRAVIISQP